MDLGEEISAKGPWFLSLDDDEREAASHLQVAEFLRTVQGSAKGKINISYDDGPRPWWHRLFGPRRWVSGFASLEWADEFASLTFLDENWSEHHVLDREHPVSPSESIRHQISHGEPTPQELEFCMTKERAFRALHEALQSGQHPTWLSYQFVA